MKHKVIYYISLFLVMMMLSCQDRNEVSLDDESFTFSFMTYIYLNFWETNSFQGFQQAISEAKRLGADFIITGGDNVDANVVGDDREIAEKLFIQFKNVIKSSPLYIKVTIGNHDRFWDEAGSREVHGTGMFSRHFGPTYYDYDYKGVHFIHLNTSEVFDSKYCVSERQLLWLGDLSSRISKSKPIVLTVHVPFLSFYYPALSGYYTDTDIFSNFKVITEHK